MHIRWTDGIKRTASTDCITKAMEISWRRQVERTYTSIVFPDMLIFSRNALQLYDQLTKQPTTYRWNKFFPGMVNEHMIIKLYTIVSETDIAQSRVQIGIIPYKRRSFRTIAQGSRRALQGHTETARPICLIDVIDNQIRIRSSCLFPFHYSPPTYRFGERIPRSR